jgi:murein DD-endopeptidase MepM/ murein hydrolase activator NlpD
VILRWAVRSGLALLAAGVLLAPAHPAAASSSRSASYRSSSARSSPVSASEAKKAGVDSSIQAVNGQLDEVEANEAALQSRLDAAAARQATLTGQLAAYDARLATVRRSLQGAQSSLDRASALLVTTRLQLARVRAQEDQAKDRLRIDAVTAYVAQPANGLAAAVIDLRSVNQLEAEMGYLSVVANVQTADLDRFQLLEGRTVQLQAVQQAAQVLALRQRDAVAARQQELASARQQVASADAAARAQQSSLAGLHAQLAGMRARLESQLSELQAQSDQIAALIQAEEQSGGSQPFTGGQLSEPIPGAPITSPFGYRVDPILHERLLHTGIDFGAPYGTPIHAAADGVVVAAGPEGGYGNATVIDHGGSIATLYGHQEQILVSPGDHVTRGQVIGLVGCTGWCTGPHVHFEVRVNGTPVDPAPYLGLG